MNITSVLDLRKAKEQPQKGKKQKEGLIWATPRKLWQIANIDKIVYTRHNKEPRIVKGFIVNTGKFPIDEGKPRLRHIKPKHVLKYEITMNQ